MAYSYDDAAKNLLADKCCENCEFCNDCHHPQLRKKFSTCYGWKKSIFDASSLLRIVRLAYPNTIKNDVFKEFEIKESKETVYYMKPIYTEKKDDEK